MRTREIERRIGSYLLPTFITHYVIRRGKDGCAVVVFSKKEREPLSKSTVAIYERAIADFKRATKRIGGVITGSTHLDGKPIPPLTQQEFEHCVNIVKDALPSYSVRETWNGVGYASLSVSIEKRS
jgi:hypothetical protein